MYDIGGIVRFVDCISKFLCMKLPSYGREDYSFHNILQLERIRTLGYGFISFEDVRIFATFSTRTAD